MQNYHVEPASERTDDMKEKMDMIGQSYTKGYTKIWENGYTKMEKTRNFEEN